MNGNIRRKPNGSWELRVYIGRDPVTGKHQQISRTVRGTKRRADAVLRQMVTEVEGGTLQAAAPNREMTLSDLFERRMRIDTDLASSTARGYRSLFKNHVDPAIGNMPVRKISARTLNDLYIDLLEGLSVTTVRQIHAILSSTFEFGITEGGLVLNPARAAKVRRKGPLTQRGSAPPSEEVVNRLLDPANHPNQGFLLACRLAVATGARRGELCGLQWGDLEGDRLHIRRSVFAPGRGVLELKTTKNRQTRRIGLDPDTVEMLQAIRLDPTLTDTDYILSGEGKPWTPDWLTLWWGKLCRRLGVSGVRFHDLRHFHATQLLKSGRMDLPSVATRLGHAQNSTTLNIYAHATPDQDRRAAEIIGEILWGERRRTSDGPQ